jgi:lysine 2,3-aminomutase
MAITIDQSSDAPPGVELEYTPRPALWADVPDEQWNDWRWQLANRLNSLEELEQVVNLTDEEREGLSAEGRFRVDVTPYFASLLEADDPRGPVRLQVLPKGRELAAFDSMFADSLNEDAHSPVPGLVHRYPDRVLMLVTTECASYCRYCTRSRMVGDSSANFSSSDHQAQIDYIRNTPQVRDVLLSGGDPLTMPPKRLEKLLAQLYDIPHLDLIRIGSRVPIFLPQRITDELVEMLRQFHPLWINIHVNHPREITPELSRALAKLADGGIPLGNQAVLLRGVNDSPEVQLALVHKLIKNRVRPYYLYQCDLVQGAGHFRTPVSVGLEIMEALRGHTSGFAVPVYIIDAPGGGGKVPVAPEYVVSRGPNKIVLRNYEGFVTTYTEPEEPYERDDEQLRRYLDDKVIGREEGIQKGVSALASGQGVTIKPEGWEDTHSRGREGEAEKRGVRNFQDEFD